MIDSRRVPTAALAGLTLVVGFAVAAATTRALGGVVLVAGVAWCVAREARRTAWWRLAVVVVAGGVCFAVSHPLGRVIGAWPAVLLAAATLAAVTWALVDRRRATSSAAAGMATAQATEGA